MSSPLLPPRLRPGGRIGVIAPASPPRSRASVRRGLAYLRSRGFSVTVGESVGSEEGYLAGNDSVRLEDVHRMFADPAVDAIMCLRGGYGSARLLEDVDWGLLKKHPKILVGFSDVTALSLAMLRRASLLSFAGPMVAVEMASGIQPDTERRLWNMLMTAAARQVLPFNASARSVTRGNAEGHLLGGNLAVLLSLLGTRYMPEMKGAVLFLEDVGESVYRIDRMLRQLQQAGVLRQVAGVALGSFTGRTPEKRDRDLDDVFDEYFAGLPIPVVTGLPFGHIADKATLPIGAQVRLDASRKTLTVTQRVVL